MRKKITNIFIIMLTFGLFAFIAFNNVNVGAETYDQSLYTFKVYDDKPYALYGSYDGGEESAYLNISIPTSRLYNGQPSAAGIVNFKDNGKDFTIASFKEVTGVTVTSVTYHYTGTVNGVDGDIPYSSTEAPIDCGTYTATVDIVIAGNTYTLSSSSKIRITQRELTNVNFAYVGSTRVDGYKKYNISDIKFFDYTYDAQEHTFEIYSLGYNDDAIHVLTVDTPANVGYTRKYYYEVGYDKKFAAEGSNALNYIWKNSRTDRIFCQIVEAEYDMSGVEVDAEDMYNGELQFLEVSNLPTGLDGIQLEANITGNGIKYPGTQQFTVTYSTASPNYKVPASEVYNYTIYKCQVSNILKEFEFTYDGTPKLPEVSIYWDKDVHYDCNVELLDENQDNVNVGTFKIKFTVPQVNGHDVFELVKGVGYTVEDGVGYATITINKRPIEVTVSDATSVYGSAISTPTIEVTSENKVVGNDQPWKYTDEYNALTSITGVVDGSVAVLETNDDNYDITFVDNEYSITPFEITVTADDKTSVYGEALEELTATLSNSLISNDDPADVYSLSKLDGLSAGEYDIRVVAMYNPNYYVDCATGVYTITPRKITVTADDKSSVYGEEKVEFTATLSENALAYSDKEDDVFGFIGSAGTNAGTYDIYVFPYNDNYEVTCIDGTYTILPREVTITGITTKNKTYNGKNDVELDISNAKADEADIIGKDIVNVASAVGHLKAVGATDSEVVYIDSITLDNANYKVAADSQTETSTAIIKREVIVSGVTALDKNYDGNTNATLSYSGVSFENLILGDEIEITATGTFANKDAADEVEVSISNYVVSGKDAANYSISNNSQTITSAAIFKQAITVSKIEHISGKTYDGTDTLYDNCLTTRNTIYDGLVDGETLGLTFTSIVLDSKNAGTNKTVTIKYELAGDEDVVKNYYLAEEGQQETITGIEVKPRTLGPVIKAVNPRTYNGTNDYYFARGEFEFYYKNSFVDAIEGDDVSFDFTITLPDDRKNVGKNKALYQSYMSAVQLYGDDKDNYAMLPISIEVAAALRFELNPINLTVTGITAEDKNYDGTVFVELVTNNATLNGVLEGDDVTLSTVAVSGQFEDANVGEKKIVNISNITLDGEQAQNYTISSCTTTATISKRQVTITGIKAVDKVYDGNKSATFDFSEAVIDNIVKNEALAISSVSGEFDSKDAGADKTAYVTEVLFVGAYKDNYMLKANVTIEATASISAKELTVSWELAEKYYYTGSALELPTAIVSTGIENEVVELTVSSDKDFINAGEYVMTAEMKSLNSNYKLTNATTNAVVNKGKYDMSAVSFKDATYTYDGAAKELLIAGTLPQGVEVSYENNTLTNVGKVEVTAKFVGDSSNYEAISNMTATLTITKATYDMTGISFKDATYTYDGEEKVLAVAGTLPTGVTVSYESNKATDAGTYNAVAKFSGDSTNYEAISNMEATLTIKKATYDMSTIKFEDTTYTYDGEEKELVIIGTLPEDVDVSYENNILTNVGEVEAVAKFYVDSNHEVIADMTAKLAIKKAKYDMSGVKFEDKTYTFDGTEVTLIYSGTLPSGVTVSYESNKGTNAGVYNAVAKFSGNENYEAIEDMTATLTIEKATYSMNSVTFEDTTYIYDGREKALVISGKLPKGVEVSYTSNKGTDAGTYNAVAKFVGNENYEDIANMTAKLVINKATYDMTGITFEDAIYTYDGQVKEIIINGELPIGVAVSYESNKGTNVGTYNAVAKYVGNENYNDIADMTATLTIEKATYDMSGIKFEEATYTYDGTEKELLIEGTLPEGVEVSYENNKSANAGTYNAVAKFVGDTNYNDIEDLTATLTITKATYDMSGVAFNDITGIYNGTVRTLRITGTLPTGVIVTYENNTLDRVGEIEGTAKFTGDSQNYYEIADMTAKLVINKATYDMTGITFENATYTYDGTEKEIVIAGTLPTGVTVSYISSKGTNAGTYNAVAKFVGNANYNEIEDLTATLTITKATYDMSGVSFNNITGIFNWTIRTLQITGTLPTGVTVTYENNTLDRVGEVEGIAKFTGDYQNYNEIPDMTAKLVINKATYDMTGITFEDATYTYNGQERTLSISGTLPVGLNVSYESNKGTNAGTYNAVAKFVGNANYNEIENMTATLTITKATYDMSGIKFENKTYTYDGKEKALTITGTLPEGVTVTYTNNKLTNAGTVTATAKFACDSTNYNLISDMTATLTIKDNIVVKTEDGAKICSEEFSSNQAAEGVDVKALFDNAKTNSGQAEIKVGGVTATFDKNAVDQIASNNNVMLKVEQVAVNADAGEVLAVEISLSNVKFDNGKATITLAYDKKVPEDKQISVYFVSDSGEKEKIDSSFNNGGVKFEINHFSKYVVTLEARAKGLSGGAIVGIIFGVLFVLAIIAAGILFVLHKEEIITIPFLKRK